MKDPRLVFYLLFVCSFIWFFLSSCSKGGAPAPPPNPPGACSGITITVSATSTNAAACLPTGTITVTASGSSNLTYSLDGSTFQAANSFSNLAKGNYTVTVKNNNNCRGTATVTVNEQATTAGPLFTAAKAVIQTNCVVCHQPGGQMPNPNFLLDCIIVANAQLIKTRAVDQGTMPPTGPLSQGDKDKIAAWVNAGGKLND